MRPPYSIAALALAQERAREATPEQERLNYARGAVKTFKCRSARHFFGDWLNAKSVPRGTVQSTFSRACGGHDRMALELFRENQKRVLASDQESPLGLDWVNQVELDPEGDEAKAFIHYTTQTLKKSPKVSLRWDDWEQSFYPSNGGESDFMPGVDIPRALTGLVTNFEEIAQTFRGKKEEIQDILSEGNLVIVSNHCTWLNLPLIVSFLHKEVGIPLDRINTILGPALTTYKQGHAVAGISNMLKTIPDTPNGRLDDVAPDLQSRVRRRFIKALADRGSQGQVIVMSPGGTTDRVLEDQIQLLEASSTTQNLAKRFAKKSHVWPIATHTGALYAGQKIQPGTFHLSESGIMAPNPDGENPIRVLKRNIRDLNPDREVHILPEDEYRASA